LSPILERLRIAARDRLEVVGNFGRLFHRVAGGPAACCDSGRAWAAVSARAALAGSARQRRPRSGVARSIRRICFARDLRLGGLAMRRLGPRGRARQEQRRQEQQHGS
jgi:hypothetical protein